jgi:O-antigen ligase
MITLAYCAVWFFVFSVPWENAIGIPGLGAISRLTGMIAIGLTVLATVVTGRVRRWHPFHLAALLFVTWAGCSVLVFGMVQVPKKIWTYLQLFLVLWMIWQIGRTRKRQLGLLLAYVFGAYISAFSTIMVARREAGLERRFTSGNFDANDLAGILALALPMAWYLSSIYRRPLLRWVCRSYVPVAVVAIGLTGSRGGMLATIVALMVIPLSITKLSPGRLAMAIAILCISGFLATAYLPETVVKRLATTSSDVQTGHLGGRLKLWVAGARAFATRPILGWGTAGFRTAISHFLPTNPQVAHNSYLSVLVENGLLGFAFFLWMLLAVLRGVWGLPKLDRRFAVVLFATLALVMLPLAWEDQKPTWCILAILIGLARATNDGGGGPVPQEPYYRRVMPAASGLPHQRPRQPLAAFRKNLDRDGR